jgi:hypothetical protein
MSEDKLSGLRAELARQDEELARFEETLRQLHDVDVPAAFLSELDEACEVEPLVTTTATFIVPVGIRA